MHEPFYFIKYPKNRNQVEISKIKELCHSQSLYYYDYIKRFSEHNGKTIEKVRSISFQEGSFPMLFEIKLDKVIYDFVYIYGNLNLVYDSRSGFHILLTPPTGIEKKVKTL